jgi:hypothetical protein
MLKCPWFVVRVEGIAVIGPEGFDAAIIGVGSCAKEDGSYEEVLVYDIEKMMDILVTDTKMSQEDASEFLFLNIISVYLGEGGPLFVHSLEALFPTNKDTVH